MAKQPKNSELDQRKSRENLIPFQPGESGNPKGRPKGCKDGLRACLRRALAKNPTAPIKSILEAKGVDCRHIREDASIAEALADVLVAAGLAGDIDAIKLAFTQTEEPLKQTLDLGEAVRINLNLSGKPSEPETAQPA